MANSEKVRIRHEGKDTADTYVSKRQLQVFEKNGWREVTPEEIEAEKAEKAAGDDDVAGDDTAAPDADNKSTAPRGRPKGAASAADKKEA